MKNAEGNTYMKDKIILDLTGKRNGDKLRAALAHNGPTKPAMVSPVADSEFVPTVRAKGHILVTDPRHHRPLYG